MAGEFTLRPSVSGLPAYVPGASGDDPSIYKLSSNEVPSPPAPAVLAAISDVAAEANRYPEMYGDTLCHALAQRHGLSEGNLIIGNGSVSLLELILRAAVTTGDEVVYSWRSFEAYPILVQVTGATSVQVPNTPTGEHDFEAMAAAITERTKIVMVCTPNNPTSQAATHSQIGAFLDRVPSNVLVVLDEAYAHFDRTEEKVDSLALLGGGEARANLIVLRTFSKAYGMAGLRVGYAMGPSGLMSQLRSASTPFGVNAVAGRAALAALESEDYTDEVVEAVIAERARVTAELRAQGWDVGEPQGNFYWLPIGERSHAYAAEALASGFTARPFPEGVRVTIGEPEANDLALALAATWARDLGLTPVHPD